MFFDVEYLHVFSLYYCQRQTSVYLIPVCPALRAYYNILIIKKKYANANDFIKVAYRSYRINFVTFLKCMDLVVH